MKTQFWVASLLLISCGCSSKPYEEPEEGRPKLQLTEIHRMIKLYETDKHVLPSRFEDLRRFETAFAFAVHALKSGECVVVWSALKASAEDGVLAYAKDAPSQGGFVVLKNGNVKKMTADELKTVLPANR